MPERTVFCVKLQKELPGLDEPPFDTEFGKKIYENVSQQAWQGWTEFLQMLLNDIASTPLAGKIRRPSLSRWSSISSAKALPHPRNMYRPFRNRLIWPTQ